MRRALHWSVYAAIVLAVHTRGNDTVRRVSLIWFSKIIYEVDLQHVKYHFFFTVVVKTKTTPIKAGSYLISISARLLASIRRQYLN